MTNREKQIYLTLVDLKDGRDVNEIPFTILQELKSDGYIDYIIPEGQKHPFVAFVLELGNQFIHNHAQKNQSLHSR